MASTSKPKKEVSIQIDFTKMTKRYMRFDADEVEHGKDPLIKNFYIKQGSIELDPDNERIEVTVKVVKKKG